MERTLVLVKPDGVARGLGGEVISRLERRGLKVCALKMLVMSREQAEQLYTEHQAKAFFTELVRFITSGPLIAMVIGGQDAIKAVRTMLGSTNAIEALPGTVRGDLALSKQQNVAHGSDGPASAEREIALFFHPEEIVM